MFLDSVGEGGFEGAPRTKRRILGRRFTGEWVGGRPGVKPASLSCHRQPFGPSPPLLHFPSTVPEICKEQLRNSRVAAISLGLCTQTAVLAVQTVSSHLLHQEIVALFIVLVTTCMNV